ncbi:homogentisate 1,2-dioxygenase [Flavobacterium johnsoniae]|jgi:homogentisate 1,2-dioxygenase|uniref:Homogentisate 1,2-dioxygenase n=1 Tax=Flavobacterium johnsoniae (strain ATCC 17061 / DSM 2064 / JCM 8514 / BCRC 14874 / CCUG 350202 / NBRC 14942 / NCIMB 11054 / UW101) TaxID=376686 RepID=A5FM05_FLAJ1|nr:homogentisate 1,2-dioxygenase [Flavobacterium johnsoniae]ABQ03763.1 homogentisate 1,2-dioxygenase [Flavobacterium johnsoniae UW101]OXG03285.1 homogentisate 1,2-dioxygenase [Flavobacterium johnsoniae UW101]WQG79372.1 homogentisate 1,2-dioxygenase [Flavobacterium johnsoniae UW101]SHK01998.1 homogentisate 1,2-dioxygenase [Flavobacterium johnsoniae]
MPLYHKLGDFPQKRHTQFEKPNGGFYYEQLFGTEGFHGHSSLSYHVHRPTQVKEILNSYSVEPKIAIGKNIKSLLFKGFELKPENDFLDSRKAMLVNKDCIIGLAAPKESLRNYFYKNADADEMLFIHRGKGKLRTMLGNIPFEYGDYLIIPRGIIYQIDFETEDNRLFYVESYSPFYTPKRYKNQSGQHLEHSPFCERDFILPNELETYDEKGDFLIKIKKEGMIHEVVYATHPFDVVGWDGYNFPYGFSIHNFEPITGRVHQPPPVHQTFETAAFVVCSFCPRLYDYHPKAIPAPYNHSNIDSDEVLYYVDGDFMSRNNIEQGHITLHPKGIPHGPAPGAMERSIGHKETQELAVMVDTFRPLMVTEEAMGLDDGQYYKSWVE